MLKIHRLSVRQKCLVELNQDLFWYLQTHILLHSIKLLGKIKILIVTIGNPLLP